MRYKITKQYAQDIEKLIAEFQDYEDANFFLERKLITDAEKNITLIYRIFDDQRLLKTLGKEKIHSFIQPGQYADEDQFLPDSFGQFMISKNHLVAHAHAAFIELSDAELFVEDNLTRANVITTYYIFNHESMIAELNQFVKKQIKSDGSNKGNDK